MMICVVGWGRRLFISALLCAALSAMPGAFAGELSKPTSLHNTCKGMGPSSSVVSLRVQPFLALASKDGCTVYVSATDETWHRGRVITLRRQARGLSELSAVSLPEGVLGLALTSDGLVLIAATGNGVTFLDTTRLGVDARDAQLGYLDDGGRGAVYVAITPDDGLAFVSDERSQSIGVINLKVARASGFSRDAVIGRIPVAMGPVGLAVSSDGGTLFATTQIFSDPSRPRICQPENSKDTHLHHEGALYAIDTGLAKTDPEHSIIAATTAGCNPVRVALSPAGDRVYVTARGSNALLVFDTAKLKSKSGSPLISAIPVGAAPVGVAVTPDGTQVVVANSDRFTVGKTGHQVLAVVDVAKIGVGASPVVRNVEVGAVPRDVHMTPDGDAIIVSNAGSKSLSVIRLTDIEIKTGR